jgi:integrase
MTSKEGKGKKRRSRSPGHIYARGSTWTVVYDIGHDGRGKRRQKTQGGFRTKRDAQAYLTEQLSLLNRGEYVEPTRETVGEFIEEWLPAIKSTVRLATWESYVLPLRVHVLPRLGRIQLRQLRPTHLNTLYNDLLERGRVDGEGGLAPTTVGRIHAILHRAMGDAVRWGRLSRNVAELVDGPGRRSAEVKTWESEDLRTFIEHVRDDRLQACFLLAATTGMRRGELLGLRWEDVDLTAGVATVRQTVVLIRGRIAFSEPKTERSRRRIPLDSVTIRALKAHRSRQGEERLRWGTLWQDTGLVFTREDGSPIDPNWLSRRFSRQVKSAGLPVIRFHALRHTWATLSLKAGVELWAVADLAGHSNVSVTDRFYRHAIPSKLREASEKVAGIIFDA